MFFDVDSKFRDYFSHLKQVFLYVTDECNLRCEQCIYKPSITFHAMREPYIPYETARALISDFHEMGASKLTFIGGEPTVYGWRQQNKPLYDLIRDSKEIGYEYVRLDTNGQFGNKMLIEPDFQRLDEVAFSLEGPSPELNDPIRGKNTFVNCVKNIKRAIGLGYKASITCCVHRDLLQRDGDGELLIDKMIQFAQDLGISVINFHDLFKVGVPMDTWTGDLNPTPMEWMKAYPEIRRNCDNDKYGIDVRLPLCFVTREEFQRNPKYYGYCPVKMGERVMVHPNGTIRICSNLICTAYGVARYFDNKIEWDLTKMNETLDHKLKEYTPCTNRSKNRSYGNYVPVCFSFKPQQEEIVWKDKLQWEDRRMPVIA